MTGRRVFYGFIGLAAVLGLCLQYWLQIASARGGLVDATIAYLSYFTIIGNMIGAAVMLAPAFAPKSALGAFSLRPDIRTAVTLYHLLIGFIYHMILTRQLAPATGLGLLSDYIIHTLTPVAFAIDWILLTDKRGLKLRMAASWAIMPAAYGVYTLIRGAVTGAYPYWFLQVDQLGAWIVARNFAFVLTAFFLGSYFWGALLIRACAATPCAITPPIDADSSVGSRNLGCASCRRCRRSLHEPAKRGVVVIKDIERGLGRAAGRRHGAAQVRRRPRIGGEERARAARRGAR